MKDKDIEGYKLSHCDVVLHQSLKQLYSGFVIAQEALNHYYQLLSCETVSPS